MRAGKTPVYASHDTVPTPDHANYGIVYNLSTDDKMYIKTSDGVSTQIGGSASLCYEALLNADGATGEITAMVGQNDLGEVSFLRNSQNNYDIVTDAQFPDDQKVFIYFGVHRTNPLLVPVVSWASANAMNLKYYRLSDAGGAPAIADEGDIRRLPIKIVVYS